MCLEMKHGDWIGECLGEARAHFGDKLVLSDGYAKGTVFPDNTCLCPVDLEKTAAKMGGGSWENVGPYYEYFPEGDAG